MAKTYGDLEENIYVQKNNLPFVEQIDEQEARDNEDVLEECNFLLYIFWRRIAPAELRLHSEYQSDKNWFLKAYETLVEKRFQVLYKSAKYITSGSSQYRRCQLYADVVLRKLDAKELDT